MSAPSCDCKRAKHTHGTIPMYQLHRCRCASCRAVKSAQSKDGTADVSMSAKDARKKIESLRSMGASYSQIAEAVGVHGTTIRNVAAGRAPRIRTSVSEMILNVDLATLAETRKTVPSPVRNPAPLAQAQLRELYALGWTAAALLKAAGLSKEPFRILLHEGVATAKVEEMVARGYAILRRQTPPSQTPYQRGAITKARLLAQDNNWDAFMSEFAA